MKLLLLTIISLLILIIIDKTKTTKTFNNEDVIASLRFPKKEHTYDDNWKEFEGYKPKLKRWIRQPDALEHADVNMNSYDIKINDIRYIENTTDKHFKLYENGFEISKLRDDMLPIFKAIKEKGLDYTRAGPTMAEGNTDSSINDLKKVDSIEDLLAKKLQGHGAFTMNDYFYYNFRCAGFVIRKGGPEGKKLEGTGFDLVALRVHIDQDMQGEPLRQMGVELFFRLPFIELINVWTPLQDIKLRPLAFADLKTVNVNEQVLRYRANSTKNAGGNFGSFQSDRRMALHQDEVWYYYPDVTFGHVLLFDTFRVPHSSFTLPGETVLSIFKNNLLDIKKISSDTIIKETEKLKLIHEICIDKKYLKEIEKIEKEQNRKLPKSMYNYIESIESLQRNTCVTYTRIVRSSDKEKFLYKLHKHIDYTLELLTRSSLEIRCAAFVMRYDYIYLLTLFSILIGIFLYKKLFSRKNNNNNTKIKKN